VRLENRVAVVTGAGRGIGRAIAIRLSDEGARVVIDDVDLAYAENVAEKLRKMGREVLAFKADVSSWYEVVQMFNAVERRFGGVDILVNNAGIRRDVPFHKVTEEDWDSAIASQLKGCFMCARAAQKYMVRQNYGKIINLSSPVPAGLGERGQTSYASASAAIEGFTRALAYELGPHNINVNCIAPDFIDTEMTRNAVRKEGMYLDDFRKIAVAQIPLGRLGTAEDVANVALFLATDESSFISGQTIYIRGGP